MTPATQIPVLPALIAERIREARKLGWQPGEGHGIFVRLPGAAS